MTNQERSIVALVVVVLTGLAVASPVAMASGGVSEDSTDVTLTVTVTDRFGNGISDVSVTADWKGGASSGQTVSNGQVLLDVEEGAEVTITVDHFAYTRNEPYVVEEAVGQEVEVTVYRKAEGEVKVVTDGEPLRNAQVQFYQDGDLVTQGRTNADGVFASGTIERGDYQVIAVKEGYYQSGSVVHVKDTAEVTLSLEEGDVQLQVTVVDDHFTPGKPVENAEVEIETTGTVLTRTNGQQTVVVPVNTDVEVTVTKDGYTETSKTVSVGEGDTNAEFTINREDALNISVGNQRVVAGEDVRVEVTDEYGDPVEGATIQVDDETAGTTDAEGVAKVPLEASGTVSIAATDSGVTSEDVTVEVIGDETPTEARTETPEEEGEDEDESVPGFGLLAAALALAGTALLSRRLA